jgi:hypothetical protein
MASLVSKTVLNRWTPATPVRADFGTWVAYLSIDAAAVRAGGESRGGALEARARLLSGGTIEHHDGSTYQLVCRPGQEAGR